MRIEEVGPQDASGELDPATYRVLLWNRPITRDGAWALDEWDVDGAADVFEVVEWAQAQEAATYEIAVRWPYTRVDAAGNPAVRFRYVRIAGSRGGDAPTTRSEAFSRTE
jgi:hypothetical protein